MKHFLLLCVVLLGTSPALAESLVAPLKIQTVQVIGEKGSQTSCRLYRKRVQQFLQRVNEASIAASIEADRVNLDEIRRLLDLLQRVDVPLELQKENIHWTLDFDTSKITAFFDQSPMMVSIDSTYLQWQTDQGFFPDHFRVDMSADLNTARVSYKMNYMEACLAPVSVAVTIANSQGQSIFMQTLLNRNLL